MVLLNVIAKSASANSFASQVEADEYLLLKRIHASTDWNSGISTAAGYVINDPGGTLTIGATTIPVKTGTGTFQAGDEIQFAGDSNNYEITVAYSGGAGNISITPGLLAIPADGAVVSKVIDAQKKFALIWATSLLEIHFEFEGSPTDQETQALVHPRWGMIDKNGNYFNQDIIAQPVKDATSEFAYYLKKQDRVSDPGLVGKGFSEVGLGPISLKVNAKEIPDVVPTSVIDILKGIGTLKGASRNASFRVIDLNRV